MTIVNVLEAKTNLSRLIAEVEAGGEVVIARHNKPVVRLVPAASPAAGVTPAGVAEPALAWAPQPAAMPFRMPGRVKSQPAAVPPVVRRVPGRLKGLVEWDDRFDDPLPDEELRLWNGEGG